VPDWLVGLCFGLLVGLCFGWALGFVACWAYFQSNRHIRTRREWYADRQARGLPVPEDWEDDHAR
jgi:hypothetical protein